jgi:hypothetical protein
MEHLVGRDVSRLSRLYRAIWRDLRIAVIPLAYLGFSTLLFVALQAVDARVLRDYPFRSHLSGVWVILLASVLSAAAWLGIGSYHRTFHSIVFLIASLFAQTYHSSFRPSFGE